MCFPAYHVTLSISSYPKFVRSISCGPPHPNVDASDGRQGVRLRFGRSDRRRCRVVRIEPDHDQVHAVEAQLRLVHQIRAKSPRVRQRAGARHDGRVLPLTGELSRIHHEQRSVDQRLLNIEAAEQHAFVTDAVIEPQRVDVLRDRRDAADACDADIRVRRRLSRQRNGLKQACKCRAHRRSKRLGRHGAGLGRSELLARSFVVGKEEESIAFNRAAQAPTELLEIERGLVRRVEKVSRVQLVVAIKEIAGALEMIRARFRDRRDDGGGGAAVFGREVRRENTELLHALTARRLQPRAAVAAVGHERIVDVGDVGAVEQEVVLGVVAAVEGQARNAAAGRLCPRRRQRQPRKITAVHRKIEDPVRRNLLTDFRRLDTDERRFDRYGYRFGDALQLELERNLERLAHT